MAVRPSDVSVTNLGTLNSTDSIPIDRAGVNVAKKTTPADILTYVKDKTAVTGLLKGNGTNVSAAVAETDYSTPDHRHFEETITPDVVEFQLTPTTPTTTGSMFYNAAEKTVSFILDDGGSCEMGKEMFDHYTVLEAGGIVDGDIVSIVGASGNRSAVALTDATDPVKAFSTIGMCTVASIANNNIGRITTRGHVHNLNTLGMTEGAPVFVDPLNPGKWTQTRPTAPTRAVQIGIVVVASSTVGVIDVAPKVNPDHNDAADLQGGTTAEYYHLTAAEYSYLYGQMPGSVRAMLYSTLDVATDTGNPTGTPDYVCLLTTEGGFPIVELGAGYGVNSFPDGTVLRVLNAGNNVAIKAANSSAFQNAGTANTLYTNAQLINMFTNSPPADKGYYVASDDASKHYLFMDNTASSDFYELYNKSGTWVVYNQNFLNWMDGQLAWDKVDKTGAVAGDVGLGNVTNQKQHIAHGWVEQPAADPSFTGNVYSRDFTTPCDVAIGGVPFTLSTTKDIDISALAEWASLGTNAARYGQWFIWLKADLTLMASKTPWEILDTTVISVDTAYCNDNGAGGIEWILARETHQSTRNLIDHKDDHFAYGAKYISGFTTLTVAAGSANTFTLAGGEISDEGLRSVLSGSQTTCRIGYKHATANALMFDAASTTYTKLNGSNKPYFDNNGTLTLLGDAGSGTSLTPFGVVFQYASNRYSNAVVHILGQAAYANKTAAESAASPTLYGLSVAEWKLVNIIVFRAAAGTGLLSYVSTIPQYNKSTGPAINAGAPSTVLAGNVTYTPTAPDTSTNAQAALDARTLKTFETKATTFAPVAGGKYICDTNGAAFGVTLPVGVAGDVVEFWDYNGTWGTNALTLTPATGEKINGQTANETFVLNVSSIRIVCVYTGTTRGWQIDIGGNALADGGYVTLTGVQTLTNKTLTAPSITGNTTTTGTIALDVTPTTDNYAAHRHIQGYALELVDRNNTNAISMGANYHRKANGDYVYKNNGAVARWDITNGAHNFYTAASGTAGDVITFSTPLTLAAAGATINGTVALNMSTTASAANVYHSADGTTLLRSTSSIRYKQNIETLEMQYANNALNLRPVWYKSKADADNPSWGYYGLIAEEVAQIDPRLVHFVHEHTKLIPIDEDGNLKEVADETSPLIPDGVQYERLSVLLLAIVQKQQVELSELKLKVDQLTII